jgi:hypothetical protein
MVLTPEMIAQMDKVANVKESTLTPARIAEMDAIVSPSEPSAFENFQSGVLEQVARTASGEKPLTTLPFRYAKESAELVGDVGGQALSAITPDVIEEPIKKYAGQAMEYIAGTKPAQMAGEAYGAAKEFAPDVMDVAEGALSMGSMGVGGKAVGRGVDVATAPARSALTPTIPEGSLDISTLARKYDIPLSLPQVSDSRALGNVQKLSQEMPFSGAEKFKDLQRDAWQKEIFKTIGVKANKFNPVTMDFAFKKVGKEFDDLTKGKNFVVNNEALESLSNIEEAVRDGVYGAEAGKLLQRHTNELFSRVKGDSLSGENLVSLRNKLSKTARTGTNVDAQQLAKDFESVLVDMIGRDAPQALQQAKSRYKNLIVLEPLAQKAKGGYINPTQLNTRAARIYGRQHTIGKSGEIGDLARIGSELLGELGGSDTVQKGLYAGAALGGGYVEPLTTGAVLSGNRAMQSGLLRNQNVIDAAIEKALKKRGNK